MNDPTTEQPNLQYICSNDGVRIDRFLSELEEDELYSRSFIERLIADGMVRVDGKPVRKSFKVTEGDVIAVWLPEPEPVEIVPQDIPIDVVFEDEYIAVVNKPAGMCVHPGPGHSSGALVNALAYRFARLAEGHGPLRPGIVHRLDKDTSGLLLVAKDDRSHSLCSTLFAERQVRKEYLALALGVIEDDSGELDTGLARHSRDRLRMAVRSDGKQAITQWRVEERAWRFTRMRVRILTGRTHQIRVHLEHMGHPVLGDRTYGNAKRELAMLPDYLHKRMKAIQKKHLQRQMLHAAQLAFRHPVTGEELSFVAPEPQEIADAWVALRKLEG